MKVLSGELTETQYEWPEQTRKTPGSAGGHSSDSDEGDYASEQKVPSPSTGSKMTIKSNTILRRNEATYIHGKPFVFQQIIIKCIDFTNDSDKIGLHRVANLTNKPAVSLHLYTPAYDSCKFFDEQTSKTSKSGKCVFFSKGGKLL
jgi:cysteine dioxygenase